MATTPTPHPTDPSKSRNEAGHGQDTDMAYPEDRSGLPQTLKSNVLSLSTTLLQQVKLKNPYSETLRHIESLSLAELTECLTTDPARKTFWINLYNALYQIRRRDQKAPRKTIFTTTAITFGNTPQSTPRLRGTDSHQPDQRPLELSLDQIEHTLLRGHRHKYALGYLPAFKPADRLKPLIVQKPDYRIHFALNCGARSCPPILACDLPHIEAQLDLASESFIAQDTDINPRQKKVRVSRIYLWFLADFGGFRGIRRILSQTLQQPLDGYRIRFKPFDWTEELNKLI